MAAEILKFPHNNKDVILSLMETAKLLEETSAEQCISIQRDVIDLLVIECNRLRTTCKPQLRGPVFNTGFDTVCV